MAAPPGIAQTPIRPPPTSLPLPCPEEEDTAPEAKAEGGSSLTAGGEGSRRSPPSLTWTSQEEEAERGSITGAPLWGDPIMAPMEEEEEGGVPSPPRACLRIASRLTGRTGS